MSSKRQKIWALVLFDEENVLSHPIPLGQVQDLSGRTVEEAHLREGAECMARVYVGDRMRKATIVKRSENREELNKIYKEMVGTEKENQASQSQKKILSQPIPLAEVQDLWGRNVEETYLREGIECMTRLNRRDRMRKATIVKRSGSIWQRAKALFAGLLVGGAAMVVAPLVLSPEGFSSGGDVTDSWMATLHAACTAWFFATTNLIIGTIAVSAVSQISGAGSFRQRVKALFIGLLVGGAAVAVAPLFLSPEGFFSGRDVTDSWTVTLRAAFTAWFSATTNLIIGTIAMSAVSLAFKIGNFWQKAKILFASLLVGGAAVAVAPLFLSPEGFSSGRDVADPWTATLQTACIAWFSATKNLIIGIIAVSSVLLVYKLGKDEPPEDSDPPSQFTPKSPEAKSSSLIHPVSSQTRDPKEEDLIAQVEGIDSFAKAVSVYRENQRLHEEKQCKICMDAEMDTLFTPCGHMCSCRRCAEKLKKCPMCLKIIHQSHRVYKS